MYRVYRLVLALFLGLSLSLSLQNVIAADPEEGFYDGTPPAEQPYLSQEEGEPVEFERDMGCVI